MDNTYLCKMMGAKLYLGAIFLLLQTYSTSAQVLPAPGARLNYTQVMFDYPAIKGARQYVVEIVEDTAGASFNNPVVRQKDSATATLISNLNFGKHYLWRYGGILGADREDWRGPYGFEILGDSAIGTSLQLVVVNTNDSSNVGGLIFLDCIRTAVDRRGKAVWYLPLSGEMLGWENWLRDLKMTPYGTVTLVTDSNIFECDINGHILWKGPNDGTISGDKKEYYHHDFKRLADGNYMALGNQYDWKELPVYVDTSKMRRKPQTKMVEGKLWAKAEYGTVMEYDQHGNLVWSWNSKNYVKDIDIYAAKRTSEEIYLTAHSNSFTVDSSNRFVYMGFRDLSRIIKIEKSSGRVVQSWGIKMPSGEVADDNHFFAKQHDVHLMTRGVYRGALAVFNNDIDSIADKNSSVVIFSQPEGNKPSQILWKFDCDIDPTKRIRSTNGGNVDELPGNHLLVCTGSSNRIFEVTMDKHIAWNAELQRIKLFGFSQRHSKFNQLYRAHYASSLYPCYFAAQVSVDTSDRNAPVVKLKIYNKGSEDDSYVVDVIGSDTGKVRLLNTGKVAAQTSASYEFDARQWQLNKIALEMFVHSNTNPDLVRTFSVD